MTYPKRHVELAVVRIELHDLTLLPVRLVPALKLGF